MGIFFDEVSRIVWHRARQHHGFCLAYRLAALMAAAPALAMAGDLPVADAHAHAAQRASVEQVSRSLANYTVPSIDLVREDGRTVRLEDDLGGADPVVLNFVYTTCTTVCPMLSATFEELQRRLGASGKHVRFASVSIDPEEDTPDRLREYARHFNAGSQWHFYTGTTTASLVVQRAFNVFRGDKMSHVPVTLLRTGPGKPWVRFDGFASTDDLLSALRDPMAVR